MKVRVGIILLVSLMCAGAYGQQKRHFLHAEFKNVVVDDTWIIVKYKPQTTPGAALKDRALAIKSATSSRSTLLDGMMKIRLLDGQDPIALCNELMKDPAIEYAEPILRDYPLYEPSDQLTSSQYYLTNIKAYEAWDITRGDDDITVAIIDTGLDLDHEDLADNIWTNEADPIDGIDNDDNGYVDDYYGYDFADNDNDPEADQNTHGARVGGVAGARADNGIGIAGVGFNTKIAALKGFRSSDGLSNGLFDAILYAVENGIQVVNLSWGSIRPPLQSEQDIINYAVMEKNVVVVAAAGNDGNKPTAEEKFYPASYDNVLSVAGSDANDQKWSGSTYNYAVDLMAPASGILSTTSNNNYNSTGGFGTSFAAPMVAAAAALVMDQYPTLTARQIMERVRVTTDDVYDLTGNTSFEGKLGKGRLNILRAVSESNVKSLRAEVPVLATSNDQYAFFGDTVQVSFTLTNFLNKVNDPAIFISSPENEFTVSQGSFFPGSMNSMASRDISFEIILSEDLEPETTVGIRLDYSDGSYSDFQFLDITTSPDYVDFDNESVRMTIAGNGYLGLVALGNSELGSGFVYQSDTLMKYTGILLAKDDLTVADNIISDYNAFTRGSDFMDRKNYKLYHHQAADHFGYSEFTDEMNGLVIEQSNIAWNNDDFMIIRYRVINITADPISNLTFGVFSDWDLDNALENYAEFDLANEYLFARNSTGDMYAGTKVIGGGTSTYSALDMDTQNGNDADVTDILSDAAKYDFLVNQSLNNAGSNGNGNDVAAIHGLTIANLDPYADSYINVIYAAANSQSQLESAFSAAESKLDEFIQYPSVLETFYTCDGLAVELDPTEGTNYTFYEDPLGALLITSGDRFTPATISSDTSFYVRNMDSDFPSDIFEIRVLLQNEIADFELSVDTLYLDNATNIVQFTDLSQDAISWSWDFGQGTQATIQNPAIAFNQEGTYNITLMVENSQGCTDDVVKSLVVASRPTALAFEDFTVCPGGGITLSDPSASKLEAYSEANDDVPVIIGPSINIGPINQDTTVYVAARINGLLTGKVPVSISVHAIEADFMVVPDTLSENHQLRLIAMKDESATIQWTVDGSDLGTSDEIVIDAAIGSTTIVLELISQEGCTLEVEKTFNVSSSPTPVVGDVSGCEGESIVLKPGNGTYFGFYLDESLNDLISKGTQLVVEESSKIFVVNLDDGLPGTPVEVNTTFAHFEIAIDYTTAIVGKKHKVELSLVSSDAITTTSWYVDGNFQESTLSPIFFFDPTIVEVVAEATSAIGCTSYDTLQFDFTPPLAIESEDVIQIYPNPVRDKISILTQEQIQSIQLRDVAGRELGQLDHRNGIVDVSAYPPGLYLLRIESSVRVHDVKILIE